MLGISRYGDLDGLEEKIVTYYIGSQGEDFGKVVGINTVIDENKVKINANNQAIAVTKLQFQILNKDGEPIPESRVQFHYFEEPALGGSNYLPPSALYDYNSPGCCNKHEQDVAYSKKNGTGGFHLIDSDILNRDLKAPDNRENAIQALSVVFGYAVAYSSKIKFNSRISYKTSLSEHIKKQRPIRVSGSLPKDDAINLGKDFIGKKGRVVKHSDGNIKEIYSADGKRRFRYPAKKSDGRYDANFEQLNDNVDPTFIQGQKNPWKNSSNYTNTHLTIRND